MSKRKVLIFLSAFVIFISVDAVKYPQHTLDQQLLEQAQRTKIISYQKNEPAEKKMFHAIDIIKNQFECKTEHLLFLGVFIVIFENFEDSLVINSILPDDVVV